VLATHGFDVSKARLAPRVKVSTHQFDGFQIGATAVPPGAAATIAAVVADLTNTPTAVAKIEGFTDEMGPSFSDDLARSRQWAELTRDAIIASGTVGGKAGFNVVPLGSMRQVATNDTEPHRRQNRRVVITVERPGP